MNPGMLCMVVVLEMGEVCHGSKGIEFPMGPMLVAMEGQLKDSIGGS